MTPLLGVLIGVVTSIIIIAIGVVACIKTSRWVPLQRDADLSRAQFVTKRDETMFFYQVI